MYMKTFFVILENVLKKDHPDIELGFYVSRRSKFVHMGSDVPLTKIKNFQEILTKIERLWKAKKKDDKFSYCEPLPPSGNTVILSLKKIMSEIACFFLENTVSVECLKASTNAMKPLHLTSGSAGSDLFSTSKKLYIGEKQLL